MKALGRNSAINGHAVDVGNAHEPQQISSSHAEFGTGPLDSFAGMPCCDHPKLFRQEELSRCDRCKIPVMVEARGSRLVARTLTDAEWETFTELGGRPGKTAQERAALRRAILSASPHEAPNGAPSMTMLVAALLLLVAMFWGLGLVAADLIAISGAAQ